MEAPLGGEGDEHEDRADRRHDPRRCELQRRRLVGLRHCPSVRPPTCSRVSTLLSFQHWLYSLPPPVPEPGARASAVSFVLYRGERPSKRHRTHVGPAVAIVRPRRMLTVGPTTKSFQVDLGIWDRWTAAYWRREETLSRCLLVAKPVVDATCSMATYITKKFSI